MAKFYHILAAITCSKLPRSAAHRLKWWLSVFGTGFLLLVVVWWQPILVVSPVSAQSASDPRWTLFAQEKDGLISNDVTAILLDDGALWFGTNEGISRYDGAWTSYPRKTTASDDQFLGQSAPNGRIQAFSHDSDSKGIWSGTDSGQIAYWDGTSWANVIRLDEPILSLDEIDGELWIGASNGLFIFDGDDVTPVDEVGSKPVHAILSDGDEVWVGANTGLWQLAEGTWRTVESHDSFSSGVYALWLDDDGTLWTGTSYGITWREPLLNSWDSVDILDEIGVPAPVQTLAGHGPKSVWAGTDGAGAVLFNRANRDMVRYGSASDPNLTTRFVRDMDVDQDGSVWMATTAGVYRFQVRSWFNDVQGTGIDDPANYINDLLVDRDGMLWIATGGAGLRRKNGVENQDVVYADVAGLPPTILTLAEDDSGAIWAGGFEGIHRFVDGEWSALYGEPELPSPVVTDLLAEGSGMWIGTEGGLTYHDGKAGAVQNVSELTGQTIESLALDSLGRLWVGTQSDGITIRDEDGDWRQLLHDPDDPTSLPDNKVVGSGMAADPNVAGGMWVIFANEGLMRWNGAQWDGDEYSQHLPSNLLWTLFVDPEDGNLWVGSEGGVSRYDGITWGTFGASDGLVSPVTYAITRSPQGGYWFGGRSGLSHYLPEKTPPWIEIGGVNDQMPSTPERAVEVIASENVLVDFEAGDLQTPQHKLKILYRQIGMDNVSDWQDISPGFLQMTFPDAGEYALQFLVRDQAFNYSHAAEQNFQVVPPAAVISVPVLGEVPVDVFRTLVLLSLLSIAGAGYVSFEIIQHHRRTEEALNRGYNPYISGEPIRTEDMFFGRHRLVQRIVNSLHTNSIMIHGERRIGKTTLLYQLVSVLREVDDPEYWFVPLYIDLEGTSEQEFFHTLMEEISENVRLLPGLTPEAVHGIDQLRYHQTSNEEYGDREFNRDLRELIALLQTYGAEQHPDKRLRLILLMDEMDVISRYDHLIQQQLRRIFMRDFAATLGAVVAGIQISKEWDRVESPWFNLFNEIKLEPFDRAQAMELLVEPVRETYSYEPAALEYIVDQSDGRPFRLQQYGLEAVNHMLADGRTKVTLDDVETAHKQIMAQVHSMDDDTEQADSGSMGNSELSETAAAADDDMDTVASSNVSSMASSAN